MPEPFVPSTQDIRECYAALGSGPSWDERVKEFDRWLSQLAADGRDSETVMTGHIIYEPKIPTSCDRGQCEGKPRAESYRDGTIWECDHCGRQWIVWSGSQYNEHFSAWKLHREPPADVEIRRQP